MSLNYVRCNYVPDGGQQCDHWITPGPRCPLHINHVSASAASNGINTQSYLEIRNSEAQLCYQMSLEELDAHIAKLEGVIEQEKAKSQSARAVRADKIDKLSEEEREVRRKIKTEQKEKKASEPKKVTIKSDPIRFFMQTYNISEAAAKLKLGIE